ncbi:MAG TPA: acyl-CoA dehydrogenase family protein [Candidatus Dormibacteraeota bacterium]|nr:acyl-CoA dehydrogenase family protein [Candidatus Dormibacteraeota bacterium]
MPDANRYREDRSLRFAVARALPADQLAAAEPLLDQLGALAGDELDRLAAVADRNPPVLRPFDRDGERVDEVVHHPAYRELERLAFERFALASGCHPPVLKYALTYLFAQAEFGVLCPVNMTDSLAAVLRRFGGPGLRERYLPRLTAVDGSRLWQGAMFLTERGGGSDVGATGTVARPVRPDDPAAPADLAAAGVPLWRLTGSKWFCSNVDAELALVLARPDGAGPGTRGLGLFLLPRHLADGRLNGCRIERLKDKLGTRDMATGELTLDGALAHQVGELDRGFVQMAAMINASRLSNAVRSAALMRRAFVESMAHARSRGAFGRRLIDLPLQRRALMEMLLDVEGAVAAVFEAAAVLERGDDRLARILTPLLKATVTKRARLTTAEGMEARGGNGYVEEWVNARLLRDAHLGSIWEGTTNVVQLDVLRAMVREGAHRPLLDRLAAGARPPHAPLVRLLERTHQGLRHRCEEVLAQDDARRELAMPRLVPALYHLVAATSLAEAAADQLGGDGSARQLLVAAAYAARWLGVDADPLDEPDVLALLEPVERWDRLPAEAAAAVRIEP